MPQLPFAVVDLTHPLAPGMPLWPEDPPIQVTPHATLESDGYSINSWQFSEHGGTHIGAPGHRIRDGVTVDRIPGDQLLLPLVIIGSSRAKETMVAFTVSRLERFEAKHGRIPEGCCVALRTGWDKRWPETDQVFERNDAGAFLWPGFAPEAIEWLAEERCVVSVGSDAPDIGTGSDKELQAGRVCAERGLFHVENLANLDQMPAVHGFIVIGALPLAGGTGSPARVLGLRPK